MLTASLEEFYAALDQTCLVMIDRSMWFAKSLEALSDGNFRNLVDRHPYLRGSEQNFREPVVYAFSYAQRVFLCSAMEKFLRSISPIYIVDRIRAPLFVLQGKNDPRVPYTESEQIVLDTGHWTYLGCSP